MEKQTKKDYDWDIKKSDKKKERSRRKKKERRRRKTKKDCWRKKKRRSRGQKVSLTWSQKAVRWITKIDLRRAC